MEKRDYELLFIFSALLVIVFFLGRHSKSDPVLIPEVDISKYTRKNDSLEKVIKSYRDSVKWAYVAIDSLSKKKVINNKKVKNDKDVIIKFTPTSRHRWNDSVLRAEGLK